MEPIEQFCEVVRQNFSEFTFKNKRLALEVLSIKAWVDGNNLEIEGAIPIAGDNILIHYIKMFRIGKSLGLRLLGTNTLRKAGYLLNGEYSAFLLSITHSRVVQWKAT